MLRAQPRGTPNLERQRAGYDRLAALYRLAEDVDVQAVSTGSAAADWVRAGSADASRAMLYLHGGGYVIGSRTSHRELASRLSRAADARLLVLDYRRAPESPFPACLEDATAAYRWMLEQGLPPSRIVIAGDSAGGGLAVATMVALRDAGSPLPAAAVLLSPWVDLELTGASAKPGAVDDPVLNVERARQWAKLYAPGNLRAPLASPLHADLHGLPPCLIQAGECEILRDDASRLAVKLEGADVLVDLEVASDMMHVWHQFAATSPEASAAVEKIGRFVRAHT